MRATDQLRLKIGPLPYLFIAHDDWGGRMLDLLRDSLQCRDFEGKPRRTIHLRVCPLPGEEPKPGPEGRLPERLSEIGGPAIPLSGWKCSGDDCGFASWLHPSTRDSFWTFGSEKRRFRAVYQLPWFLLIRDLETEPGGLIHAGLADLRGRGFLFLAPPQGGKSTCVSKLPAPPWRVLGDDTAIFWNESGRPPRFFASPLPTWSALLGSKPPRQGRWDVGAKVEIGGIYVIRKGRPWGLRPLSRPEAIQSIYAGLSEHVQIAKAGADLRPHRASLAVRAASALEVRELSFSLEDRFREILGSQ